MRVFLHRCLATFLLACAAPVVGQTVRINEFLADNNANSYADEDGDTPDWIELYNPGPGAQDLTGWSLTDDAAALTKWAFPAVSIPSGGYLIVFASGKDRAPTSGILHANFLLASGGEYVALVRPDGTTLQSEFGAGGTDFPSQRSGISYGIYDTPEKTGFLSNPTPNAANDDSSGFLGYVKDTQFSVDRGFFDAPFSLTISTLTPGATIRYTTNGDWPTETSGTVYTDPITVDRTLPVKAIAYQEEYQPTNVDTHTYIFVDDVVTQTSATTQSTWGFPSTWDGVTPYYGMNRNPTVNPLTHPTIKDDLKTVPTLSITMDADDLFGSAGIYSHPTSSGVTWERLTSLELIDPADPTGGGDFQQNCAIRIQGGAFRNFSLTKKKSFRVLFKSEYGTSNLPTGGPGSLNFPVFGTGQGIADKFQTLVLRMESNDGWQWSGANQQPQFARDEWGRRVQLALGQPASHGRRVHVYLNGVYWGNYNLAERPDGSFAESYIPGADRDLWEGQNSGVPINSTPNLNDWNSLNTEVDNITAAGNSAGRDAAFLKACGFNPDGTRNPAYHVWCDPTNYADYLLINYYAGNSDWPRKNYYGGIDTQAGSTGYKFFMWDAEWSLFLRSNINTNRLPDFRGIAAPQDDLEGSVEYQVRFGDRAHNALFNDGPLTPARARAIYDEVTADHLSILVPESARWGNQHGKSGSVAGWQNEYNLIVNNWFPLRGDIFLTHLRARDLYPEIDAPTYAPHGGPVASNSNATLSVPGSVSRIYYLFGTSDADPTDYEHSLDPRLVGGGINPAATLLVPSGGTATVPIPSSGWLFSRSYDPGTGEWSALNKAFFVTDTVPADASNLVVSELHYNPTTPSTPAELAVSTNEDDFEFLVVRNASTLDLDLTGVRFAGGITFDFADTTLLAPGERLVLVADQPAFEARYASKLAALTYATNIFGNPRFDGKLSNSGEQILLLDALGGIIRDFVYDDDLPWPPQSDSPGYSLVLRPPSLPIPDHAVGTNWVSSSEVGGCPGGDTPYGFGSGDPNADSDADDKDALLEYALDLDETDPGDVAGEISTPTYVVEGTPGRYLTLSFRRNLHAQNAVLIAPQISTDLVGWGAGSDVVMVSETDNLDGTASMVYRGASSLSDEPRQFFRISVTAQ